MKLISIVIPCYNSEATIRKVVEMVMEEFKKMDGYDCEFVLVNDGSPKDNTYGEIKKLGEQYQNVKGINLLRNFGQHNALMAALHYTEGDFILGMDDDMQTHPSQISKLIHKMEEGYDLVYGCYPKRKNSFLKNVTSKLNEVSSRILLGRPKDIVSSNFWMITRQIKDEVVKYDSFNPYIDGIFYRTTHKIGNVEVEHFKRAVGTSNYTLKKLIKLWLAYWNYSVIPLRISSVLGGVSAAGGFLAAIMIVIRKLINPTVMVGWSSTICAIVVFSGLILMVLGIIGEYLGKMILILNRTPQYIVRETVVSHGQNLVVLAHNAGSHLGVRILRAHTGKLGNCHEIFIPGNIILSFIAHTHFPCVFLTYFASALISYRRYGLRHRRGLVQCSRARSDGHPVLRRKHRHPGEPHAFSRFLPEMR